MKPELMDECPPGSIPECHISGWMQTSIFTIWFQHFVKVSGATTENKVLLILDGHATHTHNLDVITMARENSVYLLSLPPLCSHKLQPLDVAFMKPLSTYYTQAVETWLRQHPGRRVTVFQLASLFGKAYLKSVTAQNAESGFRKTGIYPLDRHIFQDHEFAPAELANPAHQGPNDLARPEADVQRPNAPVRTEADVHRHDTPARPETDIQRTYAPDPTEADVHRPDVPARLEADVQRHNAPVRTEADVHRLDAPARPQADVQRPNAPVRTEDDVHRPDAPARPEDDVQRHNAPARPEADVPGPVASTSGFISPFVISPPPKTTRTNSSKRKSDRSKSEHLTSSPYTKRLHEVTEEKSQREADKANRAKARAEKKLQNDKKIKAAEMSKKQKGKGKSKGNAFELRRQNQNLANLRKMKHVAYSAVRHTACQQMMVGSSALRVDNGHMMNVQVLTMMMNILFVIYVRRPNHGH